MPSVPTCLHFRVDRRTRICPDCGVMLGMPAAPPVIEPAEPLPIQGLPEAIGVTEPLTYRVGEYLGQPREQQPAAPAQAPPAPVLPDTDDLYALVASLKAQTAPQAPQAPKVHPISIPVPISIPRESPDDPLSSRRRGSAGNFEEMNQEITGVVVDPPGSLVPPVPSTGTVQQPSLIDRLTGLTGEDDGERSDAGSDAGSRAGSRLYHHPDSGESMDYAPGTYPDEPTFSFLGGTAGTGKTFTAMQRADAYDDAKLVATTGIAAVNLGGITINSLLQYGDTDQLRANYEVGKLGALLKRMTNSGYYRLIVDEISMMDGHQLDILVAAIEDLNEWLVVNGKRSFGMTLVGDFAQLPPVNAPFVFQRPSWGRFEPNVTLLTEPRRQADPEFVRALQAVRSGNRKAAMDYFGSTLVQGSNDRFDGSTILAKNDEVDRYNKLRMADLTTKQDWFDAVKVGEQLAEWKRTIPDRLAMKPGALVMILANRREKDMTEMLYANGDLGHYEQKVNDTTAAVTLHRTKQIVMVKSVLKEKGSPTGRTGAKVPRNEVKGSITYMPLRVAYATTCHKSQGLSLDNVQIMFHSQFWATPGMLYVALSRARTPQGLRLVGSPAQFESRININPDIRRWL